MTILTSADAKIALGLTGTISDGDRAIIDGLLPKVDAAINKVLQYNPQYYADSDGEYYPARPNVGADDYGVWEVGGGIAHFAERGRIDTIALRRLPVRSIEEIRVDYMGGFGQKPNTFGTNTIRAAGTEWWMNLEKPYLNLSGHVTALAAWPTEPGTVLVKYTAGYTQWELAGRADVGTGTDPQTSRAASGINASDILQAATIIAMRAFRELKMLGKQGNAGFVSGPITSESLGRYSYSADGSISASLSGMKVNVPPEARELLQPYIHYGIALQG